MLSNVSAQIVWINLWTATSAYLEVNLEFITGIMLYQTEPTGWTMILHILYFWLCLTENYSLWLLYKFEFDVY